MVHNYGLVVINLCVISVKTNKVASTYHMETKEHMGENDI
jgi:hypothetical protein